MNIEHMKNGKTLLGLAVFGVVLFAIYNKRTETTTGANGKRTSRGGGFQTKKICHCSVTINGVTHTHQCRCRKCDDFCGGAINIETQPQ